jgi:hypothetical protein
MTEAAPKAVAVVTMNSRRVVAMAKKTIWRRKTEVNPKTTHSIARWLGDA